MFRIPNFSGGRRSPVGGWREKLRLVSAPLPPTADRQPPTSEAGVTLAALIVILTIISIVVAYTVPTQWSLVMKRERDRQTIFLMKQYARAILEWQIKHANTAPVSLEQLQEARKPRLLRGDGKWVCPLTGKEDDWILVPAQALVPGVPGQPPQQIIPSRIGQGNNQQNQQQTPAAVNTPGMRQQVKLNKDLSPKDYVGPFVAVRPNATGKSFIALNGAENYDEWVYTVEDLRAEIQARQAALTAR